MDTDIEHAVVKVADPAERQKLIADTAEQKRDRMKQVCSVCHTGDYVNAFYKQYDDFVVLYNEKFGKPGMAIMNALKEQGLLTPVEFDEEIEWTWFYLWHHEGRRARHGASMMAPDYAHWHGMYEVAERFYMELVPQAREIYAHAREAGQVAQADAAEAVLDAILARPEHQWQAQIADTWQAKRQRMKDVCSHCHTAPYLDGFYEQYDDFVVLYNEKFAKPGKAIVDSLRAEGLITKADFDEEIEWTWFYLWHHEGRRARHGASMMAPDYAHWHGMYEVAERFYMELVPQALEIIVHAEADGRADAAARSRAVVEGILARPEHEWLGTAQATFSPTSPQSSGGEGLRRGEHSARPEGGR
jgi:hypothetical protein